MKQIAVLGGTGEIGSRIIENLKGEYRIKASYYSNERESNNDCIYEKIDVNDQVQLKEFCKGCDVVINCAGASYINGYKVAKTVTELKIPYVDPSGEAFLEAKLEDIENKNIFVLSSGFFPGLSGLVLRSICEFFDKPISIEGFSINEEIPSYSAVEDFILTNLSGFGVALSYYNKGKIIRNEEIVAEIVKNKEYKLQNYLTVEVERIARKFLLDEAKWYNNSFGEDIVKNLQEAIIKFKSNNKKEYKDIIYKVIELFKEKVNENNKFSYMKLMGIGIKNEKSIKRIVHVESDISSEMSAIVVAYTAREILNNKMDNGIHYGMDIVNLETIMKDIDKLNIKINITDEEYFNEWDYEEGEI